MGIPLFYPREVKKVRAVLSPVMNVLSLVEKDSGTISVAFGLEGLENLYGSGSRSGLDGEFLGLTAQQAAHKLYLLVEGATNLPVYVRVKGKDGSGFCSPQT